MCGFERPRHIEMRIFKSTTHIHVVRCAHYDKHGGNSTFISPVSHSLGDITFTECNHGWSHPRFKLLFFSLLPTFFFFLTERIKLNSHILDVNWEHGATTVVIYWNSRMPPFIILPYFKINNFFFVSHLPLLTWFISTKNLHVPSEIPICPLTSSYCLRKKMNTI